MNMRVMLYCYSTYTRMHVSKFWFYCHRVPTLAYLDVIDPCAVYGHSLVLVEGVLSWLHADASLLFVPATWLLQPSTYEGDTPGHRAFLCTCLLWAAVSSVTMRNPRNSPIADMPSTTTKETIRSAHSLDGNHPCIGLDSSRKGCVVIVSP